MLKNGLPRCASNDVSSRDRQHGDMPSLAGVGARPDHDVDILIERGQELHQLFDGELIEPVVYERRDLGLRDAEQRRNFPLFELAVFEQLVDGQCQTRFDLPFGRIGVAQVIEDIGGAARDRVHGDRVWSAKAVSANSMPNKRNMKPFFIVFPFFEA